MNDKLSPHARLIQVSLLLFGSGFSALIYQVVWMRELRLIFGAYTAATAAVTAVFMGGLGFGSAVLGKRADRLSRPLMMYAGLEMIIAGLAALSPLLVSAARFVYAAAGGSMAMGSVGGTLARLLLSVLVLGGVTFAMGGTLPAAVRAMAIEGDEDRKRVAWLYGANTAGAVTGAFLATFFMLEMFGLRNSLYIGALLNGLVAILARRMARRLPKAAVTAPADIREIQESAAPPGQTSGPSRVDRTAAFVYTAAFVVGFVFFLMELVWYRMLAPILGGTTYSYGLILAMALLGIGIGSWLYAAAGHSRQGGLRVFAITCGLEAAAIAVPYMAGDWIAVFAAMVQPLRMLGLEGQLLIWTMVTALVVLPTAIIAGYQFPLLIGLLGRGRRDIGRHTGNAYAFNTAGAIAGSLAGGFGLMTVLSAPVCWAVCVVFLLVLSASAAMGAEHRRIPSMAIGGVAAVILASAVWTVPGPTAAWRHSPIGAGRLFLEDKDINGIRKWMAETRRHIVWERDGKESAVALERSNGFAFVVNGKIDGNAIGDAATQIMSGLIGAAMHPNPKRSLVIGLGTGSTAGWLADVPTMEQVDVVEIEPAIVDVAKACISVNRNVLENPKTNLIIADAREVLTTTGKSYDLIFSEPSNPYRAGIASLYTHEFYREAAERLAPGGFFIQWVQAYEIAPRTVKSVYTTLLSVFPYVETWQPRMNDVLLIGSMESPKMDMALLDRRLAGEPYRSAMLQTWKTAGIEGFLSRYVANWKLAKRFVDPRDSDRWMNTDDSMQIEFDFARTVGGKQKFSIAELNRIAATDEMDRPACCSYPEREDLVAGSALMIYMTESALIPKTPWITDKRHERRAVLYAMLRDRKYTDMASYIEKTGFVPELPYDFVATGLAHAVAGDARALEAAARVADYWPVDAHAISVQYYRTRKDSPLAMDHLKRMIRQLRQAPWADPGLVGKAVLIGVDIAAEDPAQASLLTEWLATPFSAGLLTEFRMRTILKTASHSGYAAGADAVARFEPHVPWESAFLKYRLQAYTATDHPLKDRAKKEYLQFRQQEPTSLEDIINTAS